MKESNTSGDADLSFYLVDLDGGGDFILQSKENLSSGIIDSMNQSWICFLLNIFHLFVI